MHPSVPSIPHAIELNRTYQAYRDALARGASPDEITRLYMACSSSLTRASTARPAGVVLSWSLHERR